MLHWLASAVVAAGPTAQAGLAAFLAVLRLPPLGPLQQSAAPRACSASGSSEYCVGGIPGLGAGPHGRAVQPGLGVLGRAGPLQMWWAEDAGSSEAERALEGLTRGQ